MHAFVDWRPPQATTNFVAFIFFCLEIRWPKRLHGVLPYRYRPARCLSHIYPTTDEVSFWLVVALSQAVGAIEIHVPAALSILFFSSLHSPPETMDKRPPPLRSARSNRLSNASPPADTILRLVVASNNRAAAIQDRCSARLAIFRWAPFRRPKQGDKTQRARAWTPAASIRLMGSRGDAIWIHGGCIHGEGGRSRWEVG